MNNQQLHDILIKAEKEKETPFLTFIIPSGVIQGRFKSYDHNTHIVIIENSVFSNVSLDMEMRFSIDIVQAWGKK
jgi:hypothetical protein